MTEHPVDYVDLELRVPEWPGNELGRRRSELDGALEHDLEHRWLTYTEWIGNEPPYTEEWGATEIVARDVAPWFGLRVETLFEIMAQESPASPRWLPRPPPSRLSRLLRWVGLR
jgi:hypothetical protein